MRVDFYQLERDPAERVVPMLAAKALAAGARLSIACADAAERERLSDALWSHAPDSFLAHGQAGGPHQASQPILLGEGAGTANATGNAASMLLIADGRWRDAGEGVERVLFLFRPEDAASARDRWKALGEVERHYWAQGEDGGWAERG